MDELETPTPPQTISVHWCPECGRTSSYGLATHYAKGRKCPGAYVELTYILRETS